MRNKEPKTISQRQPSVAELRPKVLRVTQKYGVQNVRIFGSFARGEQRRTSDVDLLVDLPEGMTLFDLSGLKIDLEVAVKRKVDVVPARSIKRSLRDSILADARPL
jgi:predicted nucleotidyltransferase